MNVYAVPFVRPLTVMGDVAELPVSPPGLDVAVYVVMAAPPLSLAGVAVNAIEADATPGLATIAVGGRGARLMPKYDDWSSSMAHLSSAVGMPARAYAEWR